MKRTAAIVLAAAFAGTVGCSTRSNPDAPDRPSRAAAPTTTRAAAAASKPAAKEQPFFEIESGGKVYVFGSIRSANAHADGVAPADPPVVKERFSKAGKTVVFENLGPQTDALVAAWAKSAGVTAR